MQRLSGLQKFITISVLAITLILFMFPVVWMFLTSFKTEPEYFSYPPVFVPEDFSLRNYVNAMAFPPDGRGGLQGLRDSLIIASATALVSLLILIRINRIKLLPQTGLIFIILNHRILRKIFWANYMIFLSNFIGMNKKFLLMQN